jgi:hypothetical protein
MFFSFGFRERETEGEEKVIVSDSKGRAVTAVVTGSDWAWVGGRRFDSEGVEREIYEII